jgi:PhnB protein
MSGARIAPWLSVDSGADAVEFYIRALGAETVYQLDGDGGAGSVAVARLRVGDAEFWVQDEPSGGAVAARVRMIVTVEDPDAWYDRAIGAGATGVAAVHEEYGWRTGRVRDPFGHDWEFSRQVG